MDFTKIWPWRFVIRIGSSKMFNPHYQDRTDGVKDIVDKKGVNIKEGIRGKTDRRSK